MAKVIVFVTDDLSIDLDLTSSKDLLMIGSFTEQSRQTWKIWRNEKDSGAIYEIDLPFVVDTPTFDDLITLAVDGLLARFDWVGRAYQSCWWIST